MVETGCQWRVGFIVKTRSECYNGRDWVSVRLGFIVKIWVSVRLGFIVKIRSQCYNGRDGVSCQISGSSATAEEIGSHIRE